MYKDGNRKMTATALWSRSDVSGEVIGRGRKRLIPKPQRVHTLQWDEVGEWQHYACLSSPSPCVRRTHVPYSVTTTVVTRKQLQGQ